MGRDGQAVLLVLESAGEAPWRYHGSDQTDSSSKHWTFTSTPTAGTDTAHAFTFVLLVNAAWPPGNDTSWSVNYNGTRDSLTQTQAEPRWKGVNFLSQPGSETWAPTGLTVSAGNANQEFYLKRNDFLGSDSAEMDAEVQITHQSNSEIQGVFGLVEGPSPLKQVAVDIAPTRVGFVDFQPGTNDWVFVGTTFNVNMVAAKHILRIRKNGQTDVILCVDGAAQLIRPYSGAPLPLQVTDAKFNAITTFFGSIGGNGGAANTNWTSVIYVLGNMPFPCT